MSTITTPVPAEPERFLRLHHGTDRTGLSKTEIYRRIREGTFPRSRRYQHGTENGGAFWLESQIRQWQTFEVAGVEQSW